MRKEIIIGVAVLIIYAVIDKVVFTDKVDLIYTLSQEIPSNFIDNDKKEIIQQLLIKNTGKEEATKIIIKVDRQIIDFKIVKYANSDSIKLIRKKDYFELEYPSLPTQGEIKILLKSQEKGIEKYNVKIRHNKGEGKEAFEKSSNISISFIIFVLFFLGFFINSLLNLSIESYARDVTYRPIENILKKKKPFYISHNKWSSFREDALKNYFNNDYSSKIADALSYRTLQSGKPDFLKEEEWSNLQIKAFENFKVKISDTANQAYHFSSVGSLLSLEKPKYLQEEKWQSIRTTISNFYFYHEVQRIKDSVWLKKIEQELETLENKDLKDSDKNALKAIFSINYFGKILEGLHNYDKPSELREKINFKVLNEDQRKTIDKVINLLESFIEQKQHYELLISKTRKASKGKLIIEAGETIEKKDLEVLTEINQKASEIVTLKDELFKDNQELKSKGARVTRQLEIIDSILSDPSYIDKIEDFDNPFKTGNFENLKTLANALKNKQ